jgi:flagellar biosynthesis chaperone FliJ
MSSKAGSLHRQLDEARGTISAYESTIGDYERRLSSHAHSVRIVEYDAARAKQLESTIRQLEEEKAVMAQTLHIGREYQAAFSNAADHLGAAERKISELEEEKKNMVQGHQFALATDANRISAAERKIDELERKYGSADRILSPTAGKKQRSDEVPHKDGPATRGRKRKAVAAVQIERDSDKVHA